MVTSLARPGGNVTGTSLLIIELHAKQLELLRALVPQARIALLVNSNSLSRMRIERDVQDAALSKGWLPPPVLTAGSEGEIDAVFASLTRQQVGGLLVTTDPFFIARREQLVMLAAQHAVPAIYGFRDFVADGGLISYGASLTAAFRQLGSMPEESSRGPSPLNCRSCSRPNSSW